MNSSETLEQASVDNFFNFSYGKIPGVSANLSFAGSLVVILFKRACIDKCTYSSHGLRYSPSNEGPC